MYRVSILKSTGKLLEMQSGGDTHPSPNVDNNEYAAGSLQVLIDNAIALGYPAEDIQTEFVSESEWAQICASNDPTLDYCGKKVRTKTDVDAITKQRINDLGEEKAKTEKLIAGTASCPDWDAFVAGRASILQEGDDFIAANNLS